MEHNGNISARASTGERACPSPHAAGELSAHPPDEPQFATRAEADAWWAGVRHGLRCAAGEEAQGHNGPVAPESAGGEATENFDPSGRRLRIDGWLPWKKAQFLLVLASGGIVADACRAVGMSVASAYALKSRRSGRAFGKIWDSILIHRARGRLADNNLSRAMNGCVDQVLKDGVVVAERRRFDNRLSMAMLTRLDRLAEGKDGDEAGLLRALSEDFEDYLEVVKAGGDEEAFLEAHRPRPEPEAADDSPVAWYTRDFVDEVAALADGSEWRDYAADEIPVHGLDPDRMHHWKVDDWIRAVKSHYLEWIEQYAGSGEARPAGPKCPAAYDRIRRERLARAGAPLDSSPVSAGDGNQRNAGGAVRSDAEEPLRPDPQGSPPQGDPGRRDDALQASTSSTSRRRRRNRRRRGWR